MIRHCKERTPAESRGKVKKMKYYFVMSVDGDNEFVRLKTTDKKEAIREARDEQYYIQRDKRKDFVQIEVYEKDPENEECTNFDYDILPFFEFDVTRKLMNFTELFANSEKWELVRSRYAPCEPEIFLNEYLKLDPEFIKFIEKELI